MKNIKYVFATAIAILCIACDSNDYTGHVPELKEIELKVTGKVVSEGQPATVVDPVNGEILRSRIFYNGNV